MAELKYNAFNSLNWICSRNISDSPRPKALPRTGVVSELGLSLRMDSGRLKTIFKVWIWRAVSQYSRHVNKHLLLLCVIRAALHRSNRAEWKVGTFLSMFEETVFVYDFIDNKQKRNEKSRYECPGLDESLLLKSGSRLASHSKEKSHCLILPTQLLLLESPRSSDVATIVQL